MHHLPSRTLATNTAALLIAATGSLTGVANAEDLQRTALEVSGYAPPTATST